MRRPHLPPAAVDYPTSDGKRLAENDPRLHAIHYAFGALRLRYAARADVFVSADLLIYYEEGKSRVSVAPDVFVVFGVEDRMRGNDGPLTNALGERVPHVPLIGSFGEIPENGSGLHAGMQTASGDDWG